MRNKVLILLVKAVLWVVVFFICDLLFQYFDSGQVSYNEAFPYALTRGLPLFAIFEIIDYFRKKKQ